MGLQMVAESGLCGVGKGGELGGVGTFNRRQLIVVTVIGFYPI